MHRKALSHQCTAWPCEAAPNGLATLTCMQKHINSENLRLLHCLDGHRYNEPKDPTLCCSNSLHRDIHLGRVFFLIKKRLVCGKQGFPYGSGWPTYFMDEMHLPQLLIRKGRSFNACPCIQLTQVIQKTDNKHSVDASDLEAI